MFFPDQIISKAVKLPPKVGKGCVGFLSPDKVTAFFGGLVVIALAILISQYKESQYVDGTENPIARYEPSLISF